MSTYCYDSFVIIEEALGTAVYKVQLKTKHINIVLFSLKLTEHDASRRQMCGRVGGAICKMLSVNIHRHSSVAMFALALR